MGVSRQQIEKVPHGMGHGISLCRHLIGMRADSRLSFGVRVFARTYAPEGPLGFGLPPYANSRRLPSFTKCSHQIKFSYLSPAAARSVSTSRTARWSNQVNFRIADDPRTTARVMAARWNSLITM